MAKLNYRIEEDSVGEKKVPVDAYYGVQSLRGCENFPITGELLDPDMIITLAELKKASSIVNCKVGLQPAKVSKAICKACDEIIAGKLHDEFIVDPLQGSAGTSINMNANEVIANRAIEILGGKKGDYSIVHPNDHVNYGQSTNDVIPSAGKITTIKLWAKAKAELLIMVAELNKKAKEFDKVIKMGRTQMQDAVPITLGQEFKAYANSIKRSIDRVDNVMKEMYALNMGGTAVGTGLNADKDYFKGICPEIAKVTGLKVYQAKDVIDGTQHLDSFAGVHAAIKSLCVAVSKMCNDFRLMSSGPRCGFNEINLPSRQNGSSIMPGKVNPVIPEVMSQVCYTIMGNDVAVAAACEAGQLELNAYEPMVYYLLFKSLNILKNAVKTTVDNCIVGITANEQHCKDLVDGSVGTVTAICPHVGYKKAAAVAKKAIKTGAPVKELVLQEKLLTEKELEMIFDAKGMTTPGIAAEKLLKK